jgi:release factor glutamine methyltransferase
MLLITAYHQLVQQLTQAAQPQPAQQARWLLSDLLAIDDASQFWRLADGRTLSALEREQVTAAADQLVAGVPLARILGWREFWGLPFALSPATLEPRSDSEILVQAFIQAHPQRDKPLRLLDLGTGSGCLLLSLLHEYPNAWGLGVDYAGEALQTARGNANRLGLAKRVAWLQGDWAQALMTGQGGGSGFDAIISNPPYLALAEAASIDAVVTRHDPALALWGGADGLDAYRLLLASLQAVSAPELWLEIGQGQGASVVALAAAAGSWQHQGSIQDLAGIERVLQFYQTPCIPES